MADKIEFKTCCFSGHRNLPESKMADIRNLLTRAIDELFLNGCRCFISGGALGFDMMAAELVIEKRKTNPDVKLIMLLPCRDQCAKWKIRDRRRYEQIIGVADEVEYVCENYVTGCMHLRNKSMVDRTDICVTFCQKRGGGTEYTVNYAKEKGLPVINLAEML